MDTNTVLESIKALQQAWNLLAYSYHDESDTHRKELIMSAMVGIDSQIATLRLLMFAIED